MSKHAWIQENLAAFIAGGLDAEEAERLETHVASCPNCAQALDKARDADRALTALFAGVMLDAGLEDRVIQRLRNVQPARFPNMKRYVRYAAAAAAILLVGLIGTIINQAIDKRELNIPGEEFAFYLGSPESLKSHVHDQLRDMAVASYNFEGRSLPGERTGVTEAGSPETRPDWSGYRAVDKFIGGVEVKAKDGESKDGIKPSLEIGDGSTTSDRSGLAQPQSLVGKRTKVGNVAIAGNDVTRDSEIRRQVGLYPGQTLTYPDLKVAEKNLARLNIFEVDPSNGNLVSGLTPQGGLTQNLGVPAAGRAEMAGLQKNDLAESIRETVGAPREWARPGSFQRPGSPAMNPAGNAGDETADPFPPELQKSLGYYPPSRALVVKGDSRLHTDHGQDSSPTGTGAWFVPSTISSTGAAKDATSDPSIGRITTGSRSNEKVYPNAFKPQDVMLGDSGSRQPGIVMSILPPGTTGGISGGIGGGIGGIGGSFGGGGGTIALQPIGQSAILAPNGVSNPVIGRADEPAKPAKIDSSVGETPPVPTGPPVSQAPSQPVSPRKVIIRTGEVEFEVESFDAATAIINRLVNAIPGGFVATTNSEKLPNGKVRGAVVVRTPPEHLDELVIALRRELAKGGELKGQRIGSQDITKQFTDLESRLRAARTMEERLLQIIKTGKGEVKDLLNVEKELGVWRTKIEEMEGELRFFAHQVALSTLTVTLAEKEIKAPYGMLETERINMGIETEDVEKAQAQTFTIVADVKGRITKSELKQLDAGQFNAVINFEVPPDAAGPVRDRLKQLGNLARFDVNRVMEAEGGTGKPQDGKVTRKDAQFFLSLYNLANVAPREVTNFDVATPDAEAAYKALLTRVQKLGGRIVTSNLNRQNNDQTVGTISFQVKATEADALVAELKAIGETLRHQTTESADVGNTTKSKRGFLVQIMAWGAVPARETTALQLATPDVAASYRKLQETIATAKGRMLSAQLNEQNRQNTTGLLDFEVRRPEEPVIRATLTSLGDVLSRNVTRVPENDSAISSKVHLQVALFDAARIPPRETTTLEIEPTDVDATATLFTSIVREAGGRTVESHVSRERNGKATSKLTFNVPLAAAPEVVERFKSSGIVRVQDKSRNPQVPDGPLAVARLEVTLSNSELIVPSDQGLWPQVRKGLSTSFVGLSWSLTVVIIGILFVLPWVLAIYAGYRMVRWMRGAKVTA